MDLELHGLEAHRLCGRPHGAQGHEAPRDETRDGAYDVAPPAATSLHAGLGDPVEDPGQLFGTGSPRHVLLHASRHHLSERGVFAGTVGVEHGPKGEDVGRRGAPAVEGDLGRYETAPRSHGLAEADEVRPPVRPKDHVPGRQKAVREAPFVGVGQGSCHIPAHPGQLFR